jgi:hypothetical protein
VDKAQGLIETDVGRQHRSFLAKLAVSKIEAVEGVTRTVTCSVVHL